MDIITPPAIHRETALLNDAIRSMNYAISRAVDAGVSVEVIRAARYENGEDWGDQLSLTVKDKYDA